MAHPLYFPEDPPPSEARPVPTLPLVIVVGLTGVGKSTLLGHLGYPCLPNRRAVVDRYILPRMGAGSTPDRAARFALTRAYRARWPGGIAHALAQGWTVPAWPLVFDGLRGEAEVAYAHAHLPRARFVVLEAPDLVRLERLVSRGEAFDRVRLPEGGPADLQALAAGVLEPHELEAALAWPVPRVVLREKLAIVAEERRNYDPSGPRRGLAGSDRALFLDTTALSPQEAARRVQAWVEGRDA